MIRVLLLAAALIGLSGCSEPRIDASSDEAAKASLAEVRDSLEGAERDSFDELVTKIGTATVMSKVFGTPATISSMLKPVDGKTGKEVLAYLQTQAALARDKEISKLQEQQKVFEAAKKENSLVTIAEPEASVKEVAGMTFHELYATVSNKTEKALARVSFSYTLTSPGRSVPWDEGEGVFIIKGGLEPGEARRIEANYRGGGIYGFTSLSRAKEEHADAVLRLEVKDARTADGTAIAEPGDFSEKDASRLNKLLEERASSGSQTGG